MHAGTGKVYCSIIAEADALNRRQDTHAVAACTGGNCCCPSVGCRQRKNREYYYRRADRNDLTSLTLCFNAICVSIFLFSVQPHRWHLFPPSCLLHSVRPLDFVLDHVLPCPVHSCSLLLINVLSLLSSLLFSFHVFSLLFLLFFCLLCSPLRLT